MRGRGGTIRETFKLHMRLIPRRELVFLASVMLASALPGTTLSAQEPARLPVLQPPAAGNVQRVTLKDGSQLMGRIVSVDSTSIQFESSLGVTTIAITSIDSIKEERPGELRAGRYYFPNPNATRLIFAPTGRQLRAGEGYVSDYWVFFPGVAVGLTNRFTLGGGMSVFPGVGFDEQVYFVTPKIGIVQGERFNAALGALAMSVPDFESGRESAGILYGVGTWGLPDASFTAGIGYGYVGGTLADRPVVMVGAEGRSSPRISFVTENYMLPGGNVVLSGGIRFLSRDISVDLALATFAGSEENFCCVPFLGFVWKW